MMFTPLGAAVTMMLLLRGDDEQAQHNVKILTLTATLATFLISLLVFVEFNPSRPDFQLVEEAAWLFGLLYKVGIDGISILFVLLTTFLMPVTVLACWQVKHRVKEFMAALLVLECFMIGVFCSLDLVLFYLFFEAGLIPMFLIIGIWGGTEKIYASFKFFLYTLLGSILMLIAMIALWLMSGTSDITALMAVDVPSETIRVLGFSVIGGVQTMMWLAFFASFAVKLPMWPVHTWLPDAHVQAPTGGSVILAAILLKMGGYGFLRFSLPIFPIASEILAPFVMGLSVIAIIYTSLVALMQEDMKKLIAYSSVAHMGFVTLGIFSVNKQGIDGAIFQMISHGFISAALFLAIGVIYDRQKTRAIADFGGLVVRMPIYACVFIFFTLANVGLPGTSGFVGEFLTLAGAFQVSTWLTVLAATGVILSACYALWLARRVVFGDLIKESLAEIVDMSPREIVVVLPLVAMTLILGLYPSLVTDIIDVSVNHLIMHITQSQQAVMIK